MDSVQSNRKTIMDDPFIRNYIEDLLKNIRTQVLLKLIKPYTRIRIPFISKVQVILMPFSVHKLKFVLRVLSISPLQLLQSILQLDVSCLYVSEKSSIERKFAMFICIQEINVPEDDVETLLVSLILDNRIQGHIDQVNKLLERSDRFFHCLFLSLRVCLV